MITRRKTRRFVELAEAPSTLSGSGGRVVRVNDSGTGLHLSPGIFENNNGLNLAVPLVAGGTVTAQVSSGDALRGISSASDGVYGESTGAMGDGVHGVGSGTANGVHAVATGSGRALLAEGHAGSGGEIIQTGTLSANQTAPVCAMRRGVSLNGFTSAGPVLDIIDSTPGGTARLIKAVKEGAERFVVHNDGRVVASGRVVAVGGLAVGNAAAATSPGTVVRRMEVFDASGASLGFIPIYNTIT